MNRNIAGIVFDRNLTPLLLLFTIFKHVCLNTFYDDYNPLLNAVQLMVSEVLMFHENIDLFPYDDSYDISMSNKDPTERITIVLVGIPIRNQLIWLEVVKD